MSVNISKEQLKKWADYLVDYSLGGVSKDDVVMLKGEHITWPLLSAIQEKIISDGAIADMNIVAPDNDRGKIWSAAMAHHGTVEQVVKIPAWHLDRYKNMTKFIEVLGAESPELYANVPEETSQAIMRVDEPVKSTRLLKPWVLTLFPTQGFADMEGMTLERYSEVVVNASMVDPRLLDDVEEDIYRLMHQSKTIRVQTEHPKSGKTLELKMDIDKRNVIKCTGKRNFPDGEVFTSPNVPTVEGEIFVDLPVSFVGVTIQGIYLRFEKGKIVEYKADQGFETLQKIIETDTGSHSLGEVALGMNNGIEEVLKHP